MLETTTALPAGYTLRDFDDRDREILVELRNAEAHPIQQQTAEEWRYWDSMMPDETRLRLVVDAPDGTLAAQVQLSSGGIVRHPDGAVNGGVFVAPGHRGRGIGRTLSEVIDAEARRRSAPRILSSANDAHAGALRWAERQGYREIGRRIESYVELAAFEPSRFADRVARTRGEGIALRSFAEIFAGATDEQKEAWARRVYDAEGETWQDVPFPTPVPHMPYETWRKLMGSERVVNEACIVALAGDEIAGLTTTARLGRSGGGDNAVTVYTCTRRAWRGKGVAFALKVEALARGRDAGLYAMLTQNDEPNKPMRDVNAKLGYRPLPAEVALEKPLEQKRIP